LRTINRKGRRKKNATGFTLIEIMIVLILAGVTVSAIYTFLGKQRKQSVSQRLRADVESMSQISFFIIGRDIRRAGSDPRGILRGGTKWGIPLAEATPTRLRIQADLNANGVIDPSPPTDEDIIYEFVDDSIKPDGVPDQIKRQAGDQLVIENVRAFQLKYQYGTTGLWVDQPPGGDLPFIKTVSMRLVAGTGRTNPNTGVEDTKEIKMNIRLRNYQ